MTEELTEDKNEAKQNKENPLFTEAFDAIAKVAGIASVEERLQFAEALVIGAVTLALRAGYAKGINDATELAEDILQNDDKARKELKKNDE